MKHQLIVLIVNIVLLFAISACGSNPLGLIICGDDQVIEVDYRTSDTNDLNILWRWDASEATDLPEVFKEYMRSTDDCKPVDDNKKILITSSSGAAVLVDRKSKQTLFYTHAPNAHSAEWLPNNRIVIALSTASGGNSIELYDVDKPGVVLFKDSLYSGHGVVWIPETEQLFALGYSELREYSLRNWDTEIPELQLNNSWQIPGPSGHDLISVSASRLILTSNDGVWNFDIPHETFSPFAPLASVQRVKSVNFDETTGRLIYTKGEKSWWTHHIYGQNPDKIIAVPDIRVYKVRVLHE
jgi:hypothetical protein